MSTDQNKTEFYLLPLADIVSYHEYQNHHFEVCRFRLISSKMAVKQKMCGFFHLNTSFDKYCIKPVENKIKYCTELPR